MALATDGRASFGIAQSSFIGGVPKEEKLNTVRTRGAHDKLTLFHDATNQYLDKRVGGYGRNDLQ